MARDGHTHASVVTSSSLSPVNSCRYVAPLTRDGLMEVNSVRLSLLLLPFLLKTMASFCFFITECSSNQFTELSGATPPLKPVLRIETG